MAVLSPLDERAAETEGFGLQEDEMYALTNDPIYFQKPLPTKIEFNFPPIDVAPVHMNRILTSPDLFEISLILQATRQGLQYNQILYRQNRYVEFAKDNRSPTRERRLEIIRIHQ